MEQPDDLSDVVTGSNNQQTSKTFSESPVDDIVTSKEKVKLFLVNYWRGIICIIVPILLIPIHFSFPTEKYQWCAYTLTLMAIFWVTECIPLAVTSFLPIFIFPISSIMDTRSTCRCYMNDTIAMFLGSMILANAVEQSGLHKRLALCAIRAIGYSHYRLLFAMSFITMFISMWITNTAATTMMVPINFAILKVFEDQNILKMYDIGPNGETIASDITTCYFCAATFSATIGGIGTLVGTSTNLVFKGLFAKMYPDAPEYLSFPKFSAFAVPFMLILELLMYFNLLITFFGFLRPKSNAAKRSVVTPQGIKAAKEVVEENWRKLGRITFWEIMVVILFGGAILLFFSRSPQIFPGWGDKIVDYFEIKDRKFALDSSVAMLVGYLMLLLPSTLNFFNHFRKNYDNAPSETIPSVLNWNLMNDTIPYSFMFLLGGGFALSEAAKKDYTDLNGKIGTFLKQLKSLPNAAVILIIVMFTVMITNLAANVAVCNIIAPIGMQLAQEIDIHPLWYDIAAGFSASFCFLLPVGTPGNLIVQSAAKIPTVKMIKAGIGTSIATILTSWLCLYFWAPVIWPDLHSLPEWVKNRREL